MECKDAELRRRISILEFTFQWLFYYRQFCSSFVSHKNRVNFDSDLLGIRLPYVHEEIGGQSNDWDDHDDHDDHDSVHGLGRTHKSVKKIDYYTRYNKFGW